MVQIQHASRLRSWRCLLAHLAYLAPSALWGSRAQFTEDADICCIIRLQFGLIPGGAPCAESRHWQLESNLTGLKNGI